MGIIESAATLSVSRGISWGVVDEGVPKSPANVALRMRSNLATGLPVALPKSAKKWFRVRFAVPDTVFALAFQYVWALSVLSLTAETVIKPGDLIAWRLHNYLGEEEKEDVEVVRRALNDKTMSYEYHSVTS